jgi:hypothetical protein
MPELSLQQHTVRASSPTTPKGSARRRTDRADRRRSTPIDIELNTVAVRRADRDGMPVIRWLRRLPLESSLPGPRTA